MNQLLRNQQLTLFSRYWFKSIDFFLFLECIDCSAVVARGHEPWIMQIYCVGLWNISISVCFWHKYSYWQSNEIVLHTSTMRADFVFGVKSLFTRNRCDGFVIVWLAASLEHTHICGNSGMTPTFFSLCYPETAVIKIEWNVCPSALDWL